MRRSDRLARLQELLARVQRNTAERRGELAAISQVSASLEEPAPILRRPREPIPPPPSVPRDFEGDDWSSLLTTELSDPQPFAETGDETSFPSLVPPEPPPVSEPDALLIGSDRAPRMRPEEPIEQAPESQLERAVRIAVEQRPQAPDPGALWLEAAEELRERRITLPPEEEPAAPTPASAPPPAPRDSRPRSVRPAAIDPHADTPAPIATFETTHASASRSFDSVAPPPASRRRRPQRPSPTPIVMGETPIEKPTPYWAVVLLGSAVGLLFTLAYIAFRAFDDRGAIAQAVPNTTHEQRPTATVDPTSTATTATPPIAIAPAPSSAALEVASGASSEPPLPAIRRPKDMGLLWVDTPFPVSVYVQGLPAGENGAYLEVSCGLKNVRLARRDLPPPGHSFPMWLGKAESVLVPCGAANRVKMSSE